MTMNSFRYLVTLILVSLTIATRSFALEYTIGDPNLDRRLKSFVVLEISSLHAFNDSWSYIVAREASHFSDGSPQWLTWFMGDRSFDTAAANVVRKALQERDLRSKHHLSYVRGAMGLSPTNVVPNRVEYAISDAPLALRQKAVLYMTACFDGKLSICDNGTNYAVALQAGIVGQVAVNGFDSNYYDDVWLNLRARGVDRAREPTGVIFTCIDRETSEFFSVKM